MYCANASNYEGSLYINILYLRELVLLLHRFITEVACVNKVQSTHGHIVPEAKSRSIKLRFNCKGYNYNDDTDRCN